MMWLNWRFVLIFPYQHIGNISPKTNSIKQCNFTYDNLIKEKGKKKKDEVYNWSI